MRLVIRRNQQAQKGMLGGNKGVIFTLSYKLELTSDELQLVETYRLREYPVTFRTIQGVQSPDDTIGNMLQGRSQTLSDVKTLIRNEEIVKNSCDDLWDLFSVIRTFGGDDIVEYPRS